MKPVFPRPRTGQRLVRVLRGGQRVYVHDGAFDPSEHPHAPAGSSKGGQFTKKGTVGMTVLGPIIKQHGLQKLKVAKEGHLATFVTPKGVKVHIHPPPEGKTYSSHWTSEAPGHKPKSGVGSSLGSLLASHAARQEEVQKVVAEEVEKILAAEPKSEKIEMFTKATPEQIAEAESATKKKSGAAVFNQVNGPMAEFGYSLKEADDSDPSAPILTYTKGNGAAVIFTPASNPDGLTWLSKSPGNQTKSGDNLQALADLLSGKSPSLIKYEVHAPKVVPKLPDPPKPKKEWATKGLVHSTDVATHDYGHFAAAAPKATHPEQQAIGAYSGSSYLELNSGLREGIIPPHHTGTVSAIDSYLSRASIPSDTVLFRGVKENFSSKIMKHGGIGMEFVDNGYASHTTRANTARNFAGSGALLHVRIPKGAPGAAIKAHSHNGLEDEVLFKRGSRFRITGVDAEKRHIFVDMVL